MGGPGEMERKREKVCARDVYCDQLCTPILYNTHRLWKGRNGGRFIIIFFLFSVIYYCLFPHDLHTPHFHIILSISHTRHDVFFCTHLHISATKYYKSTSGKLHQKHPGFWCLYICYNVFITPSVSEYYVQI